MDFEEVENNGEGTNYRVKVFWIKEVYTLKNQKIYARAAHRKHLDLGGRSATRNMLLIIRSSFIATRNKCCH